MNPLKSSLELLYDIGIQEDESLRIKPIHWWWFALKISTWLLIGVILALTYQITTGDKNGSAYVFVLFSIPFFIGAIRINLDLKWTYEAQSVNQITFTKDTIKMNLIEANTGKFDYLRAICGIPRKRIISEDLIIALDSIKGWTIFEETVNSDNYFVVIAECSAEKVDEIVYISPRLKKQKDIENYVVLISYYLELANVIESE